MYNMLGVAFSRKSYLCTRKLPVKFKFLHHATTFLNTFPIRFISRTSVFVVKRCEEYLNRYRIVRKLKVLPNIFRTRITLKIKSEVIILTAYTKISQSIDFLLGEHHEIPRVKIVTKFTQKVYQIKNYFHFARCWYFTAKIMF